MDFNKPFTYDSTTGRWNLEMYKAQKDMFGHCGVKITFDPGFPTGEKGAFYNTSEESGLTKSTVEIRCFDNLSGWTSAVVFDFQTLIEKLIEIMPKDKVRCETFVLAERDFELISKMKGENK